MTTLPVVQQVDCWNRIGVHGDHSCPELQSVVHCHNCPVFARAGRRFLDAPSPGGYLEEWAERLAAPIEEQDANWQSVLTFRLGEEWLALPVRVLVEVTAVRPVHRVPHRGGLLAGLVNIRGELHLCVHLARLLGVAVRDEDNSRHARFLVVQREADRWVFPVDEVDQVQRFPADQLGAVPATVGRATARLTRGVFQSNDRSIGYLEDERLFQVLRARVR